MTDLLNTGKSALFAFQRALTTTSHNIANVNTEGYSRQRVDLQAIAGETEFYKQVGGGVRIADIERVSDQFATARVHSSTSAHAEQQTHHAMASRLDNLVAAEGASVAPALSEFFNALQDANADPSSIASREVVLDRSTQLAQRFRSLQDNLDDAQTEANQRTRSAVADVGRLAESIAELNTRVVSVSGTVNGPGANDLMDQRDKLVNELSELIDVDTLVQDNGALNVYIGKGFGLVVDGKAQKLTTVTDDTYPDRVQIQAGETGFQQNMTARLQGGEIGGLNEFINSTLRPAMAALGRLAVNVSDAVNQQHARGLDLDGVTGGDLFSVAEPEVFSSDRNSGTGIVTAQILDASDLQASDYLLRFDGANFTATRESDGVQSSGALPLDLDGLTIDFTGTPAAGDTFVVSATARTAGSMSTRITDPDKLALAGLLSTSSSIDNVGESRISPAKVNDPALGALNDPIDIVFTSETSYDIVDAGSGAVLSAGASYVPDDPIAFNGWEVSISGSARTGDTHRIEPNASGRGNNSNGQRLADMQQELTIGGTQTFNDAYGSMVSRVGSQTHSAQTRANALEALRDNAIDRQQTTQGVSLDEEAINLTRYQQAYQASAQIIATADTLFQSVLGAIR